MELRMIARIENSFTGTFGIPRQSGLADRTTARVVFVPEFRNPDALRGIEEYSHLWLLWEFTEIKKPEEGWHATVRPPRLGGNTRVGVFATRSPYRPNPIGLSLVRLLKVDYDCADGPAIVVAGADLMNGTPVYDIKPYLPYADCKPDAVGGFSDRYCAYRLPVTVSEEAKAQADALGIGEEKMSELVEVLSLDPRPAYQNDPKRLYGMSFDDYEVGFFVTEEGIKVSNIRLRSV
ncbi:MAG: tRNA (N6-threonylcarbamoyladenosine(37)-N6)-methyltransferase TrmO [Lachnospiraceae bacterium]|nr:tRNA (N6-threonylcarbamoyladenosine(37)-N6)-methyltransferase TrmO [Lachnospiraceae bacterium]